MIEKEITQAKQCVMTTRDWDTYQIIVRTCLTPDKSPPTLSMVQKQPGNLTSAAENVLPRQKR